MLEEQLRCSLDSMSKPGTKPIGIASLWYSWSSSLSEMGLTLISLTKGRSARRGLKACQERTHIPIREHLIKAQRQRRAYKATCAALSLLDQRLNVQSAEAEGIEGMTIDPVITSRWGLKPGILRSCRHRSRDQGLDGVGHSWNDR